MPLQSRFVSQLDLFTANLLKVFEKRSGQQGKKLREAERHVCHGKNSNYLTFSCIFSHVGVRLAEVGKVGKTCIQVNLVSK